MKSKLWSKVEFFLSLSLALSLPAPALFAAQPAQWNSRGPGGGGALFAPSFNPYNPGEMYLACDLSAVFHSTNYGADWGLVDFRQLQGSRPTLMQFTSNPLLIYSIDLTGDGMTPAKSGDGGATWQQLSGDPTGGGVFSLFADPNATNRLLVSDYGTLYFSTNGGNSFLPKFTNDPGGSGCYVAGAFFDGTNIYVGCNAGLLVSSNGGGTFAIASVGGITSPQVMVSFAGAKQGGTTRFFCVTENTGDVFPGLLIEENYDSYLGVYSLDWGQASWTLRTSGIQAGDEPALVAMSLTDISTAYIAGQQDGSEFPILYKTLNGGTSWQRALFPTNNQNVFTGWAGNGGDRDWSYGAGALGVAVAPNDANKICYTDLGFAHVSTNGGAVWKQLYVSPADQNTTNALITKGKSYHGVGLENTSCWTMAWADSNHVFAGYSDIKGVISADAGNSWSFGYTGHNLNTMYCCIKHPATGVMYAATSSTHDMYQSTHLTDATIDGGTGLILYSINQGVTWQTLHNTTNIAMWVAADPGNSNRLYATVANSTKGGIFVSSNIQNGGASTWTKLANPPRTEGHAFNIRVLNDGTLVCTYSGRRGGSPQAFTASSGVFVSTNSGTSWVDRSDPNMVYWTKDLVVDTNDPAQNTWYVGVFSGYGGPPNGLGGLYKTTNRGVSWMRLNSLDRVESCAINPLNANELYLTTEVDGLWISTNINAVTPTFTQVAAYPFRQPERIFFNPFLPSEVWVTSFGHGMRVGSTSATSLPGKLSLNAATLGQNGTVGLTLQQATPNAAYTIQASTTLSNWVSLGTNSAGTNGVLQFNDTNAGGFPARFYRGKAQ